MKIEIESSSEKIIAFVLRLEDSNLNKVRESLCAQEENSCKDLENLKNAINKALVK